MQRRSVIGEVNPTINVVYGSLREAERRGEKGVLKEDDDHSNDETN